MSITENYSFAGIPVQVTHTYSYSSSLCRDYLTDEEPKYILEITEDDLKKEIEAADGHFSNAYLESLALFRKFCNTAIKDSVILFHCSAIVTNGKAYVFSAPSGTGKSTHSSLWREMLGDKAVMLNDDKPLIRLENGELRIYGTPWRGKHQLGNNVSAPLGGICFIEQCKENSIERVSSRDALVPMMNQTHRPDSPDGMMKMLGILSEMCTAVPVWHLRCNISREAAELSYRTMTGLEP